VFGSLVKQYAANEKSRDADWLIGGDCFLLDIKGAALSSLKALGTAFDDQCCQRY
jgi:Zn-dependent metalloprotease